LLGASRRASWHGTPDRRASRRPPVAFPGAARIGPGLDGAAPYPLGDRERRRGPCLRGVDASRERLAHQHRQRRARGRGSGRRPGSDGRIYRAVFAGPPPPPSKVELANATFGFASILLKSLEQTTPQHIAAAFDLPVPTFRHERDATYKATRRPMPDELRPQFERVKEILDRFGVPMYSIPGYEADDVIGALSRQADAAGLEAVIVSGDLDPLQLVTPNVKLFTTRMGFQNTGVYDEAKIAERYGLKSSQMVEFKALKGDTTENISGVPGVGEMIAA